MSAGFLAIDCGNSRLKATWLPESGASVRECYNAEDIEGVVGMAERYGVARIGMASVGNVDTRLAETLRHTADGDFMLITPRTPIPLEVKYEHPSSLGVDRKATAVAASELYPGQKLLVIDAGSAITMDLIGSSATFDGGNISPGISMRFRALHHFTAALPLIDRCESDVFPEPIPDFGDSTSGAITAGVLRGVIYEVEATVRNAMRLGVDKVVATGGDAPVIIEALREWAPELKIDYQPDLLPMGIRAIYRYNEDKN